VPTLIGHGDDDQFVLRADLTNGADRALELTWW